MSENNESMTYGKAGLLETLEANKIADEAFRGELREHNALLAQRATDKLVDYVGRADRRMFANFSTVEKDTEGKLVALKDVRQTKFSQKQWKDEINRVTLSDEPSISHGALKHPGMLLSVPEFNTDHSDFVKPDYACVVSISFPRIR